MNFQSTYPKTTAECMPSFFIVTFPPDIPNNESFIFLLINCLFDHRSSLTLGSFSSDSTYSSDRSQETCYSKDSISISSAAYIFYCLTICFCLRKSTISNYSEVLSRILEMQLQSISDRTISDGKFLMSKISVWKILEQSLS